MKKNLILMLAAWAALISCGKQVLTPEPGPGEAKSVAFDLSASHPDDTKAVKTAWEAGDAIFVFFNNVAAPKHLKMTYSGTGWTSAEYDGDTATPGALGLKNGDTGTMRAIFLPFGSNATVSNSGSNFVFSKIYYTYYLTATLSYTVANNAVSGDFSMTIPTNYLQLFVEDANAVDEAYTLGCDAVIPTGIASISASGAITETSDKTNADDLPGYAYQGGYLFSGKLYSTYFSTYGYNYYFAKTKVNDKSREDYYYNSLAKLQSHSAVKLPANNSSSWQKVGSEESVTLKKQNGDDMGKWFTCNYGESVPEGANADYRYTFVEAQAITGTPTHDQLNSLVNDTRSRAAVSIHGQWGYVFKSYSGGFLFIPGQYGSSGGVFSCTEYNYNDNSYAWDMEFSTNNAPNMATNPKYFHWPLRLLDTRN